MASTYISSSVTRDSIAVDKIHGWRALTSHWTSIVSKISKKNFRLAETMRSFIFIFLVGAAILSKHCVDAGTAEEDAELDVDFLTPCLYCDLGGMNLFGNNPWTKSNVLGSKLFTRSTKRSGSFRSLLGAFGGRKAEAKQIVPPDRKELSEDERHLVLEFAGRGARSKQTAHQKQAEESKTAADRERRKRMIVDSMLQKVSREASTIAEQYGALSRKAGAAFTQEQGLWKESRARRKAIRGHEEDTKKANKEVQKRGKDIENIGLVNKHMRNRMLKNFPPMPNPDREAALQKKLTKEARGRQSLAERLKRMGPSLRKAGRTMRDWVS